MNEKSIARLFYNSSWICLIPAVLSYLLLLPFALSGSKGLGLLLGAGAPFVLGLLLMQGYRATRLDRKPWLGRGWLWGLSFLFNAAPLIFIAGGILLTPGEHLDAPVFEWEWEDFLTGFFSLYLLCCWPMAAGLSGRAWYLWWDERSVRKSYPGLRKGCAGEGKRKQ